MGKSQRTKGHNFERAVASDLRQFFPEAKRGYQTRGGTKEAPDVDGTPFYIECKVGKRPNARAALEQARVASDGRPAVAIVHFDGDAFGGSLVSMAYSDWIAVIDKLVRS